MANYASQFKVVGSTADTDARDNTETTGTGVPIYWVNGNKLADGYSDFYDGSWDDETNIKDESGENRSSPLLIFTGSGNDGTESFVDSSSRAFGMNNVRMGQLDAPGTVNSPLSGNFVATKNENYPFYGLSPVFTIATPVPYTWSLKPSGLRVGDGFRLIFLSSTKRNASSSSIGTYNTWIQGPSRSRPYRHPSVQRWLHSSRLHRPRTPGTILAPPTPATDKGVPIYWLNGAKVADEYEDFYDGNWDNEANPKERVRQQRPQHLTGRPTTPSPAATTTAQRNPDSPAPSQYQRPRHELRARWPYSDSSNRPRPPQRHHDNDSRRTTFTRPMYGLSRRLQGR